MGIAEIKKIIKEDILIERLELEDITPEEITDDMPLFGDGLGLDSIEALDLIAGIEEVFGVKFNGMTHEDIQTTLQSIGELSQFVLTKMKKTVSK